MSVFYMNMYNMPWEFNPGMFLKKMVSETFNWQKNASKYDYIISIGWSTWSSHIENPSF